MQNDAHKHSPARLDPSVRSRLSLLLLAGACVGLPSLAAGCGSDSTTAEPFDEYTGRWQQSMDATQASKFQLDCAERTPPLSIDFPLFTQLTLEAGTISDLYESAGPGDCQFYFSVVPKKGMSSIVNPDPITAMAPLCFINVNTAADPLTGDTIQTFLVVTPTTWNFNLKAPVKGKPPGAQLLTTAQVSITDFDSDTSPPTQVGSENCTYAITENLDKISQF